MKDQGDYFDIYPIGIICPGTEWKTGETFFVGSQRLIVMSTVSFYVTDVYRETIHIAYCRIARGKE